MRISFEWEWENPIPKVKRAWREFQCKKNGHMWKKYVEPKVNYFSLFLNTSLLDGINNRKTIAICSRCGESKYKKLKPTTIKFLRYSKLTPPERNTK